MIVGLLPLLLLETGHLVTPNVLSSLLPDVNYLQHGGLGVLAGHLPYRPGFMASPYQRFPFVYPPLSLLLALPPLGWGSAYALGFLVEMGILLGWGVHRLGHLEVLQGWGGEVWLGLGGFGGLVFTRIDALQGLLIVAAVICVMRQRVGWGVFWVAAAIFMKETAVLALPGILVWGYVQAAGWRPYLISVIKGSALWVVVGLLGLLISGGGMLTNAFSSLRKGAEVESWPATLWYWGHLGQVAATHNDKLGSTVLTGMGVGRLDAIWVWLWVGLGVVGGIYLWRRRQYLRATIFILGAGLVATPVLSPQYLIPFALLLVVLGRVEKIPWLIWGVVGLGILTQLEFPYWFAAIVNLQMWAWGELLVRNLLLLGLTLSLVLVPMSTPGCQRSTHLLDSPDHQGIAHQKSPFAGTDAV